MGVSIILLALQFIQARTKMATPELTFKCELQKDGQLAITIVSCANLTDLDSSGSHNLSDPYVMVKVGQEKKFTKTISDDLNPIFPEETSIFLFEVGGDVSKSAIFFKVMDKDPLSCDDVIGQAGIKLEEGEATGAGEITLPLKSKVEPGKQLQEDQINAIYRLFSALDVNNSGEVDADPNKVKSEAWNAELKGLFKEIEVFLEDKDDSNTVSFAEFVDQFSKNPIPTSDVVNLAHNFTAALALV